MASFYDCTPKNAEGIATATAIAIAIYLTLCYTISEKS